MFIDQSYEKRHFVNHMPSIPIACYHQAPSGDKPLINYTIDNHLLHCLQTTHDDVARRGAYALTAI